MVLKSWKKVISASQCWMKVRWLISPYSDNGRGLTQEQLEKLFHPFFTTKRDQGGSGLGTHITYNLVRQTLGGSIQVSSEPGHGLSYHIRFPKNLKRNS